MLLRAAPLVRLVVAVAALLAVAACGGEGPPEGLPAVGETITEDDAASSDYEIIFEGGVADTLRGAAAFNFVLDGRTGRPRFVITLESSVYRTSGFYLTRAGDARPAEGTYPIEASADEDSTGRGPGFAAVYREGVRWQLASSAGTLRLTTATDSLMRGSFEAVMRGTVTPPGRPSRAVQVNARGTFEAEIGRVGFIIGL